MDDIVDIFNVSRSNQQNKKSYLELLKQKRKCKLDIQIEMKINPLLVKFAYKAIVKESEMEKIYIFIIFSSII